MPLYKPSELMALLSEYGASPRKVLSQNFLIDGNIINKIVKSASVSKGDLVLEIGPGPGALTEALLAAGATVIAVEKDPLMVKIVSRLTGEDHDLTIYNDDIMEFPIADKIGSLVKQRGAKAKVIANLPYQLTTPIIAMLSPLREIFSEIVVMVQEEVARRFTAQPSTSDYSSISVFINYYSNPRYEFLVRRNCFYPAPKVDSAIIALALKEPPAVSDPEKFFQMSRTAFGMRRKMLRRSLKELYGSELVEKVLETMMLPPTSRPEELSLEQLIALFEKLCRPSA